MATFLEKNLELKDGKFFGADEFFSNLKESDPGAFAEEDSQDDDAPPPDSQNPKFVRPTANQNKPDGGSPKNPFTFNGFNTVRQPPKTA